jgi:hypothetical protein
MMFDRVKKQSDAAGCFLAAPQKQERCSRFDVYRREKPRWGGSAAAKGLSLRRAVEKEHQGGVISMTLT